MGAGRKIEDEREARRCLQAAERAGQRAGEWARTHGIDGRSLHAWQLNFARRGLVSERPRQKREFASAHDVVELIPDVPTASPCGRFVLEIGDVRVEFGDDVSTATLRRVVEVLRAC